MIRLFVYKKLPVPSLWGWTVILMVMLGFFFFVLLGTEPFLSTTAPVKGDVLVVEGWMDDYALKEAATKFTTGKYHLMILTGGPIQHGSLLIEYKTYAHVAAAIMKELGIPDTLLVPVAAPEVDKDRTYESALALKRALPDFEEEIRSFDICAYGAHARRTLLLFRRVLGEEYSIGIYSVGSNRYNGKAWWQTSQGFRDVVGEAIAYIYAKFFAPFLG